MSGWRWRLGLILVVLLFLGAGPMPAKGDGMASSTGRWGSDYHQFLNEFRSGGAFKFMEDTEDLLRSGQFEKSFGRYLFLRAHIRGQSLYAGLNATVNQRLHFLREQMRLAEMPSYAAPSHKFKRRVRKAAAADPPGSSGPDQKKAVDSSKPTVPTPAVKAEDQESPAPKTSPEEKPTGAKAPPGPTSPQVESQPKEQSKAPEVKAQQEKPEENKPSPPPRAWEKIKRRLKFW